MLYIITGNCCRHAGFLVLFFDLPLSPPSVPSLSYTIVLTNLQIRRRICKEKPAEAKFRRQRELLSGSVIEGAMYKEIGGVFAERLRIIRHLKLVGENKRGKVVAVGEHIVHIYDVVCIEIGQIQFGQIFT